MKISPEIKTNTVQTQKNTSKPKNKKADNTVTSVKNETKDAAVVLQIQDEDEKKVKKSNKNNKNDTVKKQETHTQHDKSSGGTAVTKGGQRLTFFQGKYYNQQGQQVDFDDKTGFVKQDSKKDTSKSEKNTSVAKDTTPAESNKTTMFSLTGKKSTDTAKDTKKEVDKTETHTKHDKKSGGTAVTKGGQKLNFFQGKYYNQQGQQVDFDDKTGFVKADTKKTDKNNVVKTEENKFETHTKHDKKSGGTAVSKDGQKLNFFQGKYYNKQGKQVDFNDKTGEIKEENAFKVLMELDSTGTKGTVIAKNGERLTFNQGKYYDKQGQEVQFNEKNFSVTYRTKHDSGASGVVYTKYGEKLNFFQGKYYNERGIQVGFDEETGMEASLNKIDGMRTYKYEHSSLTHEEIAEYTKKVHDSLTGSAKDKKAVYNLFKNKNINSYDKLSIMDSYGKSYHREMSADIMKNYPWTYRKDFLKKMESACGECDYLDKDFHEGTDFFNYDYTLVKVLHPEARLRNRPTYIEVSSKPLTDSEKYDAAANLQNKINNGILKSNFTGYDRGYNYIEGKPVNPHEYYKYIEDCQIKEADEQLQDKIKAGKISSKFTGQEGNNFYIEGKAVTEYKYNEYKEECQKKEAEEKVQAKIQSGELPGNFTGQDGKYYYVDGKQVEDYSEYKEKYNKPQVEHDNGTGGFVYAKNGQKLNFFQGKYYNEQGQEVKLNQQTGENTIVHDYKPYRYEYDNCSLSVAEIKNYTKKVHESLKGSKEEKQAIYDLFKNDDINSYDKLSIMNTYKEDYGEYMSDDILKNYPWSYRKDFVYQMAIACSKSDYYDEEFHEGEQLMRKDKNVAKIAAEKAPSTKKESLNIRTSTMVTGPRG